MRVFLIVTVIFCLNLAVAGSFSSMRCYDNQGVTVSCSEAHAYEEADEVGAMPFPEPPPEKRPASLPMATPPPRDPAQAQESRPEICAHGVEPQQVSSPEEGGVIWSCEKETKTDSTPTQGSEAKTCSQIRQEIQDCKTTLETAKTACDGEKNSDLRKWSGIISDAQRGIDGLTGGALSMACSGLNQAAKGITNAVNVFQGQCSEKRQICKKKCDVKVISSGCQRETFDNKPFEAAVDSFTSDCTALEGAQKNAQIYANDIKNLAGEVMACRQFAEANAMMKANIPQTCFTNPSAPGCQLALASGDCSNPANAMSPICACQGGTTSVQCQQAMAAANKTTIGSGNSDIAAAAAKVNTGSSGGGASSGLNLSTNDIMKDLATMGKAGSQGPGEDVGGKMGGANVDRGSSGAGAPDGNQKGGVAAGYDTNINSGFRGGGGGGGGGGSSGSWGGRNNGAPSDPQSTAVNGPVSPNLNSFRPNMIYKPGTGQRGLAGVTGPDGLLGPHADFWSQIKNRYHDQWRQGNLSP